MALNEEQFTRWYSKLREFESLIRACLHTFCSSEEGKAMSKCPIEFYPIDCNVSSPREMSCFLTGRQSFLTNLLKQPNAGVNPMDLLVQKITHIGTLDTFANFQINGISASEITKQSVKNFY
jgi:hypothetical protein